ncbi:MAG: hypothetical protein IJ395_00475 [Clostridia bacterium]|nr:hypothetical protein [Clostridia bacterium]
MKEKLYTLTNQYKIYIVFFIIALFIHMFLPLSWADDAVFMKKVAEADILSFLNGSARPFTDGMTYILIKNQWLWRILNPLILTFLSLSIIKTAPIMPDKKSIILVCASITFPTMIMVDAGFVATTVNYLWAVTFGLLNLLPLVNSYYGRKNNMVILALLIPLLIYSTNMQQMCAVLLAVFLFANIYFIAKKTFKPYLILQFAITLLGTLSSLSLNFTGDNSRFVRESGRYFPDFDKLNIFEKTELGFSSTFYCMTMETRFAFAGFIVFASFLAVMCFKKKKSILIKALSCVPVVYSLVFGVASLFTESSIAGDLKHFRMTKAFYSFEPVVDIIFIIILVVLMFCIWNLLEDMGQKLFAESAFLLGLGSRMLMGFSPTVWASGYRTFCIMFISFIYIALIVLNQNKKTKSLMIKFK